MRKISPRFRKRIDADPYFKDCSRKDGDCEGRITIEHVFIYASKQIDEYWNFIPLCWFHHLGEGLDKEENQRIALARATDEELAAYPRKDWTQLKRYLTKSL